jgi:hypothetical protein
LRSLTPGLPPFPSMKSAACIQCLTGFFLSCVFSGGYISIAVLSERRYVAKAAFVRGRQRHGCGGRVNRVLARQLYEGEIIDW